MNPNSSWNLNPANGKAILYVNNRKVLERPPYDDQFGFISICCRETLWEWNNFSSTPVAIQRQCWHNLTTLTMSMRMQQTRFWQEQLRFCLLLRIDLLSSQIRRQALGLFYGLKATTKEPSNFLRKTHYSICQTTQFPFENFHEK